MLRKLFQVFNNKKDKVKHNSRTSYSTHHSKQKSERKGEIGEYKVNIQLDQMPKEYKHLTDILLPNPKAKSGYSQLDHVLLTPYVIFVIETKNYQGEIKGGRSDKQWNVNNRFKMMNPFHQNYGHIETLIRLTNIKREDIVSLISFTRRAIFSVDPELRKIASNELIVYDIELTEYIERKINYIKMTSNEIRFTTEQLGKMYQMLLDLNIIDPAIRKAHTEALKTNATLKVPTEDSTSKCKICGKQVSLKVRDFCLSNSKRFHGNVYCFEHQQNF